MSENITKWLLNGEVGMSSKCMAKVAMGENIPDRWGSRFHPLDPDDLNRCIKLVEAAPEVREAFGKIANLSPQWSVIIANWDNLVWMFHEEAGENWSKRRSAHKTYDFMQSLFKSVGANG